MTTDDATRLDRARLTVLSGPSGVGKDSVIEQIRARARWVWLSVSVTTRKIRPNEVDGVHYTFVDRPEFEQMVLEAFQNKVTSEVPIPSGAADIPDYPKRGTDAR